MALKNFPEQWGWLSKLFHWLTALLIFVQIPLGFYAESLRLSPLKIDVFVWHKSLGMLILLQWPWPPVDYSSYWPLGPMACSIL